MGIDTQEYQTMRQLYGAFFVGPTIDHETDDETDMNRLRQQIRLVLAYRFELSDEQKQEIWAMIDAVEYGHRLHWLVESAIVETLDEFLDELADYQPGVIVFGRYAVENVS